MSISGLCFGMAKNMVSSFISCLYPVIFSYENKRLGELFHVHIRFALVLAWRKNG